MFLFGRIRVVSGTLLRALWLWRLFLYGRVRAVSGPLPNVLLERRVSLW